MDVLSLQKALDKFNDETIPALERLINADMAALVSSANDLLDRLDGTKITVSIPPRGVGPA